MGRPKYRRRERGGRERPETNLFFRSLSGTNSEIFWRIGGCYKEQQRAAKPEPKYLIPVPPLCSRLERRRAKKPLRIRGTAYFMRPINQRGGGNGGEAPSPSSSPPWDIKEEKIESPLLLLLFFCFVAFQSHNRGGRLYPLCAQKLLNYGKSHE